MLLSYWAVSLMPSPFALPSTCVSLAPSFVSLMARLSELPGSPDSTQTLWSVKHSTHKSFWREKPYFNPFSFIPLIVVGEDADVSHLASASLHPLTDAWQHQCLFSASHQMYWWMSCLQQCCLWCFSKLFYCGKHSYSQFWLLCCSHWVVPEPIYFSFLSWTARGAELLSGSAGTDQFSSKHPGKKQERFKNTLEFEMAKSIPINERWLGMLLSTEANIPVAPHIHENKVY